MSGAGALEDKMTTTEAGAEAPTPEPATELHTEPDHTPGTGTGTVHGYHKQKEEHLKRLRRIEGQIRGLQRMVDEDTYCIDILTQISAVTTALQSVAVGLLDEHLR